MKKWKLKEELEETERFLTRAKAENETHRELQRILLDEHQPQYHRAWRSNQAFFEARCRRCQTDEHHGWGPDNYLPWPCPSIAAFVRIAPFPQKQGDVEVEDVTSS